MEIKITRLQLQVYFREKLQSKKKPEKAIMLIDAETAFHCCYKFPQRN